MDYPNYEEEDFGFDTSFLDEEGNEDNIQSARQEHDYSTRRMLFVMTEPKARPIMVEVFQSLLPHGTLEFVDSIEAGEAALDAALASEQPYDTFVVDFKEEGVAESMLTKRILAIHGAMLLAIDYAATAFDEDKNRYKLEPLRRLFDIETRKGAAEEAPEEASEETLAGSLAEETLAEKTLAEKTLGKPEEAQEKAPAALATPATPAASEAESR
jgi:predicted hydrolase (HD superfamily)